MKIGYLTLRCFIILIFNILFKVLDKPPLFNGILKQMNSKKKKALLKRIRFVNGQLSGIEKMLEQDRQPLDIYIQLLSVESAFRKSIIETFETEHRLELGECIVDELENCPGSCEYCTLLAILKRDFPKLTLMQVLDVLHQIKKRSS